MPRQARLDAPGTLHHVMIRGIERSPIFKDDQDRQDFVSRAGRVARETETNNIGSHLQMSFMTSEDVTPKPFNLCCSFFQRLTRYKNFIGFLQKYFVHI